MKKRINDAWLAKAFEQLNFRFFDNRIPGSLCIKFMNGCGHRNYKGKWIPADAYFDSARDAIFIDRDLTNFPDFAIIALLHEMTHADLRFRGYKGYAGDEGHGTVFHGEIVRLWNAGAYDGLL